MRRSMVGLPKVGAAPKKPAGFTPQSVVAKRQANNGAGKRMGLKNIVTDRDPMEKNTGDEYP